MKKINLTKLSLLVALLTLTNSVTSYADNVVMQKPETEFEYVGSFFDDSNNEKEITLFSEENTEENSLDFSKLNGTLTVEVSGTIKDDSALYIAKYDKDDKLIGVNAEYNVKTENPINVSDSEYEKIYLWRKIDQAPLCESISTKCDYEIIEGVSGEWKVSSDGHTLYEYLGKSENVIIPNSYNGKRIYYIENTPAINKRDVVYFSEISRYSIFGENNNISSIKIPDGIRVLANYVFADCNKLNCEVSFPESLNIIGGYAFYNCPKISGSIDFSKLNAIYGYAFYNCSSLTGSLDLSNVTTLGDRSFYGCSGLNGTINLPAIPIIPLAAFYNCDNLTGNLVIPEGVTKISDFAFRVTSGKLSSLKLPSTLQYIGYASFQGQNEFSNELILPEGLTYIGDGAFNSTSGKFTALVLPSTLKYIGYAAFQGQSRFSNELVLPEGLTHIGDFAFNHCTKFSNTTLTIPSTVETIGGDSASEVNTHYGCHVFYDSFKKTTEFISDSKYFTSVDGVLYSNDKTRLVAYPPAKQGDSYEVLEGVTQIDEMAFGYSKIKSLTLPDSYIISENVPENVINDMANTLAIALYHNNSIENIYFSPTNTNYKSVDGIVYSYDLSDLWYVPTNKTGIITVANGTINIKKGAFYIEYKSGGETYSGVNIPSSVIDINNENLKSINLRPLSNIIVDENNPNYTVLKGKLTKK